MLQCKQGQTMTVRYVFSSGEKAHEHGETNREAGGDEEIIERGLDRERRQEGWSVVCHDAARLAARRHSFCEARHNAACRSAQRCPLPPQL
jgi:hypothetical protein